MGNAARDAQAWTLAAQAYEAALELDPGLVHIWIQCGHAHKESGELDRATAAYERAHELAPTSPEPHLHLGHVAKLRGDLSAATRQYVQAARHRPPSGAAVVELSNMVAKGIHIDMIQLANLLDEQPRTKEPRASAPVEVVPRLGVEDGSEPAATTRGCLVFDISDLISYFRHSRTPTGIQRVQVEVLREAFTISGVDVRLCAFQEIRDEWVELSASLFRELCELTNAADESEWSTCFARATVQLGIADAFAFPTGAFLINLGTSWWIPNYFMYVRRAQAEANIRYVPFVHDMIPLVRSDICPPALVRDFTAWSASVLEHADFYLVNSYSTKRDLVSVSAYLGQPIDADRVKVVPLDAIRRPVAKARSATSVLSRNGLQRSDYVLFVSTIEPRKNHILAFDAWLKVIERRGAKKVPKLVCVGNQGWMNEPTHEFLRAHPELRSKVLILSHLSDDELAELYRGCLFTLYPSQYEGWGLPVTESLSHGKVPLCSNVSSLPEAGGSFAHYFNVESRAALAEGIERLAFDTSYRKEREQNIASDFRPRNWKNVADQIVDAAMEWSTSDRRGADTPPHVATARFYSLSRDPAPRLWPGLRSTERLRTGFNWWGRDLWGCWTKPGGAALRFTVDNPDRDHRLYLLLLGPPNVPCELRIDANSVHCLVECTLEPNERRWVCVEAPGISTGNQTFDIELVCSSFEDLGKTTSGGDTRMISVGICGFYICEHDDAAARMALIEATSLTSIDTLSINRPPSDFISLTAFLEGAQRA
ncbi:glycosyltransferase [Sphingobium sp. AS12]|uniref:glycosyltransferase family 4 protein n=1 Tax=Sphingobium sp. AS12 TaxID=2849495 RepID=UPI001C31B2E9|nr:glycosyltransferase family 1 protein [Sphingobium sp. AS12]MBV2150012.1 glycosyltransferase [Sphingobium sp. AS12]